MPENVSSLSARVITVPSIVNDYTDAQLNSEYHNKEDYEEAINKYGVIYKVVQFSDAKLDNLATYAKEWIRRNYYDGVLSFNVKAVDLHLLGYNKNKIMVGDRIPVEFLDWYKTPVTKTLTCISAKYDLLKPENSNYRIGIPDVSANIKYRESITKKITTPSAKKGVDEIAEIQERMIDGLDDWGLDLGQPDLADI